MMRKVTFKKLGDEQLNRISGGIVTVIDSETGEVCGEVPRERWVELPPPTKEEEEKAAWDSYVNEASYKNLFEDLFNVVCYLGVVFIAGHILSTLFLKK